ncbi:hypothetical protein OAK94_01455, partial [bacterium]|nr:hypothetical protein [bacterium]
EGTSLLNSKPVSPEGQLKTKRRFEKSLMTTTSSGHKSVRHQRRTLQLLVEKEFHQGKREELASDTRKKP